MTQRCLHAATRSSHSWAARLSSISPCISILLTCSNLPLTVATRSPGRHVPQLFRRYATVGSSTDASRREETKRSECADNVMRTRYVGKKDSEADAPRWRRRCQLCTWAPVELPASHNLLETRHRHAIQLRPCMAPKGRHCTTTWCRMRDEGDDRRGCTATRCTVATHMHNTDAQPQQSRLPRSPSQSRQLGRRRNLQYSNTPPRPTSRCEQAAQ
jgi:hypothetical protein